jgi:hypothetical protein
VELMFPPNGSWYEQSASAETIFFTLNLKSVKTWRTFVDMFTL